MSDKDDMEEFETILLTDEDGQEVEFAVIDAAEMDGSVSSKYCPVAIRTWMRFSTSGHFRRCSCPLG